MTIFLNEDQSIYLELPDIVRAFGGDIVRVYDDNEEANKVVITAQGITLTAYFYDGSAAISLLSIIRERFINSGGSVITVPNSFFSNHFTINVKVYNAQNVEIAGDNVNITSVYSVAALGEVFGGVRFITYNPDFPNNQYFTFFADHRNNVIFTSTALSVQKIVSGNNGVTRARLSDFLGTTPTNAIITTTQAETLDGDAKRSGQTLKIYVEIDSRNENVIFLRWLDTDAMQHYRTFSRGSRSTTAAGDKYTPAQMFNTAKYNINQLAPIEQKNVTDTITFGDDAINEKYLNEVKSLVTSPKVEYYDPDTSTWVRVILAAETLTTKARDHVFNFDAVITLPNINNWQW